MFREIWQLIFERLFAGSIMRYLDDHMSDETLIMFKRDLKNKLRQFKNDKEFIKHHPEIEVEIDSILK